MIPNEARSALSRKTIVTTCFHLLGQGGPIALILAAFWVLGTFYSRTVPVFEAPFEPWHYLQIEHVAGDRPSPALTDLRMAWRSAQVPTEPPLYYLLGAQLVKGVDISADQTPYRVNPWATLGDPTATGNRNAILHLGPVEPPPYAGVSAAVHRLRALSVGCGAFALLFIYGALCALVPNRRDIAFGATALAAFTPGFLFMNSTVNNTALSTLLVSLTGYLAVRIHRGARPQALWRVFLGLAAGLAALAGRSGLAALGILAIAYVLRKKTLETEGTRGRMAWVLSFVLAFAGAGWWYSAWRRGAPFHSNGLEALVHHSGKGFWGVLGDLVASYWGVFGWYNVPAEPWFYSLVAVLLIACVGGGFILLALMGWLGISARRRLGEVLSLPCVSLVAVALTAWGCTGFRAWPKGALFYPAIGAISFLLYGSLSAWAQKWHPWLAASAVAITMGIVAGLAPVAFIQPTYAQPVRFPLENLPPDMRSLDLSFGDDLFLLGYSLDQESVTVGKTLHLRLYWTTRKRIETDYYFTVFLLGPESLPIGQVKSFPGRGNYPTRLWLPGEVVVDEYEVRVSEEARAPAAASVRLSVGDLAADRTIEAVDYQGRNAGPTPQLAVVRLALPYQVIYRPERLVGATFDRRIRLEGYTIYPSNPSVGAQWQVRLVWKALRRMSLDYTVFVHLLDKDGHLVAQADSPPLEGHYPTSLWRVGESVQDVHILSLPPTAAPGPYSLQVGWYLLESGERLPVDDANVDYVTLGPVFVDVASDQKEKPGEIGR